MPQQLVINVGSAPNDGAGDPIRTAFQKTNDNFSTLFSTAGITGIANGTSSIAIPTANSSVIFTVGNVSNVMTVQTSGILVTGNIGVSQFLTAGNITTAGTIVASGTIQSLGGITALTVTASANLIANQMRGSTLSLSGNVISPLNVTSNIAAGNLNVVSNTSVTGNVTGAYFIGDGSQLTGVTAAPANIFNIINVNSGTLIVADSPNDTLSFTASNNVVLYANTTSDSIDVSFSQNPTFVGTVSAPTFYGDLRGSVFADDSSVMVDVITNQLFATSLSTTGNVTGDYILGNGALLTGVITSVANINNGSSNVTVVSSGGNITVGVGGTSNVVVFATTGEYITGVLSVTGNIDTSANVTGGNILSTTSGQISTNGNVTGGNLRTATVVTNIGNGGSAFVNGGSNGVGNIGSSTGYFGNAFVSLISSSGNITSAANVTGVNITTAGLITATGNITGGNIATGGLITATGNITATANVTGGNITTAGLITATGNITATANVTGGNITTAGLITATGNITSTANIEGNNIVISNTLYVNSANSATAIVNSAANGVGNIGSASNYFNRVFATATTALYADLAEYFLADENYTPGTVVVFGGTKEITASKTANDSKVAGIISSAPSFVMNSAIQGDNALAVALMGRVPCQVKGVVYTGDLLITSDEPGVAQVWKDQAYKPGAFIGKSLETNTDLGMKIIEVVVGVR